MRRNPSRILSLTVLCLAPIPLFGGWQDDIGLTRLQQEAGSTLADGSNLSLSMVEAWSSGAWAPDKSNVAFAGRKFSYVFSDPKTYSPHATEVARRFFGSQSALPFATGTVAMDTSAWLMTIVGSGSTAPLNTGVELVNHSWVSWSAIDSENILKRVDYLADTFDAAQIVCVDNSTAFPPLLANSHNAIVVGSSTGWHSKGGTSRDGIGRLKPDLVGTATFTSYATPVVSTAAGLILSRAKAVPALASARKTEALKAILLAGATKSEFADWSRTTSRPLDARYGAGEANILHSYRILERGQRSPSSIGTPSTAGWDFRSTQGLNKTYLIETPGVSASELSIVLAWNRTVEAPGGDWSEPVANLANLDLKLWLTDASGQKRVLIDSSSSAIDNVEHIWNKALPPGRYLIEVDCRNQTAEYGLAWRVGDTAPSALAATISEAPPLAATLSFSGIADGSKLVLGSPTALGIHFSPNGNPVNSVVILVDNQVVFQGTPAAASNYYWIPGKAGLALVQAHAILQNGSIIAATQANVSVSAPAAPLFLPAAAIVEEISAPVQFPPKP